MRILILFILCIFGINSLLAVNWNQDKFVNTDNLNILDPSNILNDSIVTYNYRSGDHNYTGVYNFKTGKLIGAIARGYSEVFNVKFLKNKNKIAIISSSTMDLYSPDDLSKSEESYGNIKLTKTMQYEFSDDLTMYYTYNSNDLSVKNIDVSTGDPIFSGYLDVNPNLIRYSYLSKSNDTYKIFVVLQDKIKIFSADDASLLDSYDYSVDTSTEPKFCGIKNQLIYIDNDNSLIGVNLETGIESFKIPTGERDILEFNEIDDANYVWILYDDNDTMHYEIYRTSSQELIKKGEVEYFRNLDNKYLKYSRITSDFKTITYMDAVFVAADGMPGQTGDLFYVYNLEDNCLKATIPFGSTGSIAEFLFNNNGSKVIAFANPYKYHYKSPEITNVVWDVDTHTILDRFSSFHKPSFFSNDDKQIFFTDSNFIYVYDLNSQRYTDTIETTFDAEGLEPTLSDNKYVKIDANKLFLYDIKMNKLTDSLQVAPDTTIKDYWFNHEKSEISILTSNYEFLKYNYITKNRIDSVYLSEAEKLDHNIVELSPEGTHFLSYTLYQDKAGYHYTYYSWNIESNSIEYQNTLQKAYEKYNKTIAWYLNNRKTIYYYILQDPISDDKYYKGMNLESGEICYLYGTRNTSPIRINLSPDLNHFAYDKTYHYSIKEICEPLLLGVEQYSQTANSNIIITPNPAENYIAIEVNEPSLGLEPFRASAIKIYDVYGNTVIHSTSSFLRNATAQEWSIKIDISHLARGVYFVNIREVVVKFVKE